MRIPHFFYKPEYFKNYPFLQLPPHNFIEFSLRTPTRIIEKCAPLYEKSLSIQDIEATTGIPKSTVREALKSSGMVLRNPLNSNVSKIDRTKNKHGGRTPYGYVYLNGKLLIDPKEQVVLRRILKLRQAGKPWIETVIRSIVLRTKGEIKLTT